jgi:hypothetical protein
MLPPFPLWYVDVIINPNANLQKKKREKKSNPDGGKKIHKFNHEIHY